jgi:hypothetical protein
MQGNPRCKMKLCHVCNWLRGELALPLLEFFLKFCQPKNLTITPEGNTMSFAPLKVGATAAFTVVATNAEGSVVPDTNITATTDNLAVATATCNPDGSGGVVTAIALGSYNVTSTDGTIIAAPVDGTVSDSVATTLTITPA